MIRTYGVALRSSILKLRLSRNNVLCPTPDLAVPRVERARGESWLESWHTLRIFKEDCCRWVGKRIPRRDRSGTVYFGALAADRMLIDGQGEITPNHFSVDEFGVSVGGDSSIGRVNLMQIMVTTVPGNNERSGAIRRDGLLDSLVVMDVTGQNQVGHPPGIANGVLQGIGHLRASAVKNIEGVDRVVERQDERQLLVCGSKFVGEPHLLVRVD